MSFVDKILGLFKKKSPHQPGEKDIIPQPPDDLMVVQEKEPDQNIQSENLPQNKSSP
jgi:hypothetical protein